MSIQFDCGSIVIVVSIVVVTLVCHCHEFEISIVTVAVLVTVVVFGLPVSCPNAFPYSNSGSDLYSDSDSHMSTQSHP